MSGQHYFGNGPGYKPLPPGGTGQPGLTRGLPEIRAQFASVCKHHQPFPQQAAQQNGLARVVQVTRHVGHGEARG